MGPLKTVKIVNIYLDKDTKIEFRETGEHHMILSEEKGSPFIIQEVDYSTLANLCQEIE